MMNVYETDTLLSQYLLFHYGSDSEILPYANGPHEALNYPLRCAEKCCKVWNSTKEKESGKKGRALDLGCAVGRSTFELARSFEEVMGIDFSQSFIDVALELKEKGQKEYKRLEEGELFSDLKAEISSEIDRNRVHFQQGDACALNDDLGEFDCALLANLLCRLPEPLACLEKLPQLIKKGGMLMITTPSTWMEEFTPKEKWLGGYVQDGKEIKTVDGLMKALKNDFELVEMGEMPFLIREHARKYQWSLAEMSLWKKK